LTGSFPNVLRELRLAKDISARHLAAHLDISITFYYQLEAGRSQPSEKRCRQLATALDVPADTLLAAAGIIPADVRQKLCADAKHYAVVRAL